MWALTLVVSGLSLPARSHHRFKNLHIPGAATKVAGQTVANCGVIRIWIFFEQVHGRHHHSRRADATLRPAALNKGLLQVLQLSFRECDSFDRSDRGAFDLHDRNQTTIHDLTVNRDAARAAFALTATFFAASKLQLFAQHVEQSLHGEGLQRPSLIIYRAPDVDSA